MTAPTNPNAEFTVDARIGVNFQRRTNASTETAPVEHRLGETCVDSTGKVWVYVFAPSAIGSNNYATLTWAATNTIAAAASVAIKTVSSYINGTASFAAGDYGWVQSVRRLGTFPPAAYTGSGP